VSLIQSGSDIRVTRKRQLGAWGKNPNLSGVRALRGKNECCFRKIEFSSNGLHLLCRQPVTIEHNV